MSDADFTERARAEAERRKHEEAANDEQGDYFMTGFEHRTGSNRPAYFDEYPGEYRAAFAEETAWAILHAIDTAKHKHGPCPFPYGHAGPCASRGQ